MRQVTLVCGPPCAGKTTYVRQHAAIDDTVLDQDQIAQDLGSDQQWLHARNTSMRAHRRMRMGILALGNAAEANAWVIRCQPDGHLRGMLAYKLRATSVVVLKPPIAVVMQRAMSRPDSRKTQRLINNWYLDYSAADCDTTLDAFELKV